MPDRWAAWLLERRDGGDAEKRRKTLERLAPTRERVLDGAELQAGETLLDVGCGDGLIGFGALERGARVIFADVSEDLLDVCRGIAGDDPNCEFVAASADDLPLDDESVDAVATRSVLIYLDRDGKERAFREFHRVLRPGGRISIWEPINSFGHPEPENVFCGYDMTPVLELARKVREYYDEQAPGERTLIDFDERDLLLWAEAAGFAPARLEYEAEVKAGTWLEGPWEVLLASSGNPLAPTMGEVFEGALTPEERERFTAYFRALVETPGAGRGRMAHAHLRATKPSAMP
jgi:arsenite methyltransferase